MVEYNQTRWPEGGRRAWKTKTERGGNDVAEISLLDAKRERMQKMLHEM